MTFRSLIAGLLTSVLAGAGWFFVLSARDASIGDLMPSFTRFGDLFCLIAAWVALIGSIAAIIIALTFTRRDERYDETQWPIVPILLFLAVGLAALWFAVSCGSAAPLEPEPVIAEEPEPPAPAPPPEPEPEPELKPEPVIEPEPEPAPPPQPFAQATGISWPYKYPLVRDNRFISSNEMDAMLNQFIDPARNDNAARALLCGPAWIAVTGASSEEGPTLRNRARSRRRAELAADRAAQWLARHADVACPAPIVLGVDFGQHVKTRSSTPGDEAATAYQREILIISRARAALDEEISTLAAQAELETYLQDQNAKTALLAGRRYDQTPDVFVADAD
ncbi:MAG: hypothetical protein AAGD92_00505 [Pseudomonadota bacterium]